MAGGIGSRFWPYSRISKPKQFLDILNTGKSLIQLTYERFLHLCPKEHIYIVTNDDYAGLVKTHLPDISDEQILKEPIRRNTAPCILYASQKIYTKDKDATLIVTPADHLVLKEIDFVNVMKKASNFATNNEVLLTLGIKPSRPDTGYGYIQFNEQREDNGIYEVKTFTEKPTLEIAERFIESGDFLWNSGMFIWKAETVLNEMKKAMPELIEAFSSCSDAYFTDKEEDEISNAYTQCTSISIDYGLMEKAENVHVIPADFGWSDVGTWASLYDVFEKDYVGNAVLGNSVQAFHASENMVVAQKDKVTVLNGVHDFIIIDTKDVLLISEKKREQEIKQITNELKIKKLDRYL